jgi:hypothetical protein
LEVSEADGVPVLLKHLPRWEEVRGRAVFARTRDDLKAVVGDRPVLSLVELGRGTEAVAAGYPEGKVMIVEYSTPQASIDADGRFRQHLAESPSGVAYRRIGNYSAFVFDAADEAAAGTLLDQIKYEKTVQWLGEDPYLLQKLERAFVYSTRDIFFATVLVIILGLAGSALAGVGVGYVFFRYREAKRAEWSRFSDAGGMTRLNLDDLSEPIAGK